MKKLHKLFDELDVGAAIQQRTRPEQHDWITAKARWYITLPTYVTLEVWEDAEWTKYGIQASGPTPQAAWESMARFLSDKMLRVTNTLRGYTPQFVGPERYTA